MCRMSDAITDFRRKSYAEQAVEHRHGATVAELIDRYYVREGRSQQQVADLMGVSRDTVIRWMADRGIPTRDRRALAETA